MPVRRLHAEQRGRGVRCDGDRAVVRDAEASFESRGVTPAGRSRRCATGASATSRHDPQSPSSAAHQPLGNQFTAQRVIRRQCEGRPGGKRTHQRLAPPGDARGPPDGSSGGGQPWRDRDAVGQGCARHADHIRRPGVGGEVAGDDRSRRRRRCWRRW